MHKNPQEFDWKYADPSLYKDQEMLNQYLLAQPQEAYFLRDT